MKEFYDSVFTVLVELGGALESDRSQFVYDLTVEDYPALEWRFRGRFGFGGKYRPRTNTIDYYHEDSTPELDELEATINACLKALEK